MKVLVLCICVLEFVSFNLADNEIKLQIKNAIATRENVQICTTENNITLGDVTKEENRLMGLHTEPENEEVTRKLGCTTACILKRENLLEGSNIQEREFYEKIYGDFPHHSKNKIHKVAHNCLKEVRNITEECEKGKSLHACVLIGIYKTEEYKNPTTEKNEGTEQTV